jgi:hypothetical protein
VNKWARRWLGVSDAQLDGRPAASAGVDHPVASAEAVGGFLVGMRSAGDPAPIAHDFGV